MHKNHRNPKDKPYRDQKGLWNRNNFRQYAARYQNVMRRRSDRQHIHHEEYELIRILDEPRDWWMWD